MMETLKLSSLQTAAAPSLPDLLSPDHPKDSYTALPKCMSSQEALLTPIFFAFFLPWSARQQHLYTW